MQVLGRLGPFEYEGAVDRSQVSVLLSLGSRGFSCWNDTILQQPRRGFGGFSEDQSPWDRFFLAFSEVLGGARNVSMSLAALPTKPMPESLQRSPAIKALSS